LTDEQLAMVKFWAERCAIGETLRRGVNLVEELELVTDVETPPFSGRLPGRAPLDGDLTNGDVACCTGDECEAPKARAPYPRP